MKNFENFILEYRTKKVDPEDNVEIKDVQGKKPAKYGNSDIDWSILEPVDNDAASDIDLNSEDNTESMQDLIDKFDAEEDFFIIGRAGWGKTSTIRSLCKKYKRIPVTVYLDKAVASDLGGIPIPVKSKSGNAVQEMAMPSWAAVMLDNPDKDFLLFFDEMNQAAPDVMNALMPIVLEKEIAGVKFKNFFVGAAGNFKDENDAVGDLSGPLKSRFKPLITWDAGTPQAWKQVFNYLHKVWDDKLGKDFVDTFEKNANVFDNPREIEQKIFAFIEKIKGKPDAAERNKTDKWLRRIKNLAKEDLSRTEEEAAKKLAEACFDVVSGKVSKESEGGRKDRNMVDPDIIGAIKNLLSTGYYIGGDKKKYGISAENIIDAIDSNDYPREILERAVNKLINDGAKVKFNTNAEWRKAGYLDPQDE